MGLEPVGTAMLYYGLVLFTFTSLLFGKAEAKSAGYIVTAAGFMGLIMGLYAYIALGLAFPATLVTVFAVTFIMAGLWNIKGFDPKTFAFFLIYFGIVDAMYAVWFAIVGAYIWSIFCWMWFIVYLVFALANLTGKAVYLAFAKYWCLICCIVSLLIPGFLLVAGYVF